MAASPVVGDGEGSECFADDVVVDFPSVAPALDRIRNAFLADERQAPLSTSIRLTPQESVAGVTLPMTVPVRRTCRQCGGRGESWAESCADCGGSGTEVLRYPVQVTVPGGVADGTRVRFTISPPHQPPTRIELRITVN